MLLLLPSDKSLNPGPPHNGQLQLRMEWSVFNSRGLHVIHFHITSLFPKINKFRNITKLSNAAVTDISESKLENSFSHLKCSDSYNTLHCDQNRHGGGVVCYTRNNLKGL